MHVRVKKLNPHANTPAVVKMNENNPKYIKKNINKTVMTREILQQVRQRLYQLRSQQFHQQEQQQRSKENPAITVNT